MTSFFADTNIFIRFLLNDDKKLGNLAREIIAGCEMDQFAIVIVPASILEIVWLLNSFYKLSKTETISKLQRLCVLNNLQIVEKETIINTIEIYKEKNIDFIDAFFVASMRALKIEEIFSFDHDFDKIKGIKRLEIYID